MKRLDKYICAKNGTPLPIIEIAMVAGLSGEIEYFKFNDMLVCREKNNKDNQFIIDKWDNIIIKNISIDTKINILRKLKEFRLNKHGN